MLFIPEMSTIWWEHDEVMVQSAVDRWCLGLLRAIRLVSHQIAMLAEILSQFW